MFFFPIYSQAASYFKSLAFLATLLSGEKKAETKSTESETTYREGAWRLLAEKKGASEKPSTENTQKSGVFFLASQNRSSMDPSEDEARHAPWWTKRKTHNNLCVGFFFLKHRF